MQKPTHLHQSISLNSGSFSYSPRYETGKHTRLSGVGRSERRKRTQIPFSAEQSEKCYNTYALPSSCPVVAE